MNTERHPTVSTGFIHPAYAARTRGTCQGPVEYRSDPDQRALAVRIREALHEREQLALASRRRRP
jgi:hypothetical protein